ncbi:MAG: AraC family transcriptional regulator [Lachnospiraceae bacterium]|nr:AraC family transcriptional regulator [Lachnospiraceae bacterium]MDD3614764.1 AraC family transcriptional regulator [Lachnospiraceae bacterium]
MNYTDETAIDKIKYLLKGISALATISICGYDRVDGSYSYFNELIHPKAFAENKKLTEWLVSQAVGKAAPYILVEEQCICFAAIAVNDSYFLLMGPVEIGEPGYEMVHAFCRKYRIPEKYYVGIPRRDFNYFVNFTGMAYEIAVSKALSIGEILEQNAITMDMPTDMMAAKGMKRTENYNREEYHHTYDEERRFLDAIRQGNMDAVNKELDALISTTGKLSKNAVNHYHNLAICMITLSSRAVIEGGVEPSEAYETSDIYINRLDRIHSVQAYNALMRESSMEFTRLAKEKRNKRIYSNYVEQCKAYIHNRYKEKISLTELSEYIGINETYLSHLFAERENMTLKEYLNQVRVERAKNLLKYSSTSLIEISDYVGFCSQSYFGRVFKRITSMTPQQYRNQYKNAEYQHPVKWNPKQTGEENLGAGEK